MRLIYADAVMRLIPYEEFNARMAITNAPTIDAEPIRHGYWIFNPKDAIEMMFTLPKCSLCGAESSDVGNYCPHCGAKMDEDNLEKCCQSVESVGGENEP